MSDDPETARQIAELARDMRPLLVLDVDEVLLEFVNPFIGFLGSRALNASSGMPRNVYCTPAVHVSVPNRSPMRVAAAVRPRCPSSS